MRKSKSKGYILTAPKPYPSPSSECLLTYQISPIPHVRGNYLSGLGSIVAVRLKVVMDIIIKTC
jgi:hypothetical protein